MALGIETFSSLSGGNSFYKAVTHPEIADEAANLLKRLAEARSVAVYDPLGFLEGFAACHDLGGAPIEDVYVQAVGEIGGRRLGRRARTPSSLRPSTPTVWCNRYRTSPRDARGLRPWTACAWTHPC